jgi:hypothetical protein
MGMHNERPALIPPEIGSGSPNGPTNRAKLLRAFVEVGAWLQHFKKEAGKRLTERAYTVD